MTDKTKAILTISAPSGSEFAEKGSVISQHNAVNGVCIELFIPTIEAAQDDSISALIAQAEVSECEQDKIDYPDFWWELWQYNNLDIGKWYLISKNHVLMDKFSYRQHPHRKSIIEFYACSDADKLRWQCIWGKKVEWVNVSECKYERDDTPMWREDAEYRIRPKTCKVTLQNGTVMEYPEPVRKELAHGQTYFLIEPSADYKWQINSYAWDRDKTLNPPRYCNFIHLTQQAAEQHLAVLQAINSQVAL